MQQSPWGARVDRLTTYNPQNQFAYQRTYQQPEMVEESLQKGKGRQLEETYDLVAFDKEFEEHAHMLRNLEDEAEAASMSRTQSAGQDAELMDSGMDEVDLEQQLANLDYYQRQLKELEAQNKERLAQARREAAESEGSLPTFQQQLEYLENQNKMPQEQLLREQAENLEKQEQQTSQVPVHSDEELAATAGQLLERVADNQSEKFQNSNFLALMRQLRDHEVKVDGNKMVDANVSCTIFSNTARCELLLAGLTIPCHKSLDDINPTEADTIPLDVRPPSPHGESGCHSFSLP